MIEIWFSLNVVQTKNIRHLRQTPLVYPTVLRKPLGYIQLQRPQDKNSQSFSIGRLLIVNLLPAGGGMGGGQRAAQ